MSAVGEPGSEYVRLERALLCADCDAIYNVARQECPSCGGGSALTLSQVLNGDNEIVEALRAFSKLVTLARRPTRPRRPREPRGVAAVATP